eukprot:10410344-Alexandrium_andersonii.AAC.1
MQRVDAAIARAGEARWDLITDLFLQYPRRGCMDNPAPELVVGAGPASPGAFREHAADSDDGEAAPAASPAEASANSAGAAMVQAAPAACQPELA